jgi:hypothetical protein
MTAVPLSQSEIVAELLEIQAERRRLDEREMELLTLLQKPKKGLRKPVLLTFGKNIISWEGGALSITGRGYKFVKALYDADGMRRKEATLGRLVWGQEPKHHTFRELARWLAEKLEKAKFPYQLLPLMSKEKTVPTGEKHSDGKPKLKHLRPVIIGVKLTARTKSANLAVNR